MPGYGHRYWADRTVAHRRPRFAPYRGDSTADVVVIGGGLTGLAGAAVMAAGGLDVVLVEADRLAAAGTAGGLGVIAPEPDIPFVALHAACGLRVARTVFQESRRAALAFASAIKKLPARRDLSASPLIVNARDDEQQPMVVKERAARKAAGLDAAWLSPVAAMAELGSTSAGALRVRDTFVHDPVRTALALAAAAEARGARLFERSVVKRTTFTRKTADVVLSTGTIRTRGIYVATGGPGTLFRPLRRHVREEHGYVVVTEPLDLSMRRATGRRSSVQSEVGTHARWLRWLPDNRVLFAGAASPPGSTRQADRTLMQRTGQLMYELSVRYPVISGLPARWSWCEPVVTTPDGRPWIGPHRNYPFHFFAMALGWNGDAAAWMAAKAALRHFTGDALKEDAAFVG